MSDLMAIEEAGRDAFGLGQSRMENPYYKIPNMPTTTGDSFQTWQAKVNAWEDGWFAAEATQRQLSNRSG